VGAVALAPNLGYYAFEYDSRFSQVRHRTGATRPCHCPKGREPFVFVDLPELSFKRLPAMLADALPDDLAMPLSMPGWRARALKDACHPS